MKFALNRKIEEEIDGREYRDNIPRGRERRRSDRYMGDAGTQTPEDY
jgi:hypothetical protein